MVSTKRIDNETRARVHYFHRVQGLSTRETAKLCQISSASVGRICQEKAKPTEEKVFRPRGRARKLTERQERQVIRALFKLRQTEGNFTTKRIMQLAGISETLVSTKTIHRILHRHGFHYLQGLRNNFHQQGSSSHIQSSSNFQPFCPFPILLLGKIPRNHVVHGHYEMQSAQLTNTR